MAQILTDNFTRANAATLGANWTTWGAHTSCAIVTNQCSSQTANGVDANAFTGASWTGGVDQYAEVTVQAKIAADDLGPMVRAATGGAATCYLLDINDSDNVALGSSMTFTAYKVVAGAFTSLVAASNQVVSAGDVLRIEVRGTVTPQIKIYRNGALQGTATDASSPITTGNPGIFISTNSATSNGSKISLFAAGDFATAARIIERQAINRVASF